MRRALVVLAAWFACVAAARQPAIWYEGPDTFLPQTHAVLLFGTDSLPARDALDVRIYPLPIEVVAKLNRWYISDRSVVDGLTPVFAASSPAGRDPASRTFDAGVLPIGFYAVIASIDGTEQRILISVSGLGVISQTTAREELLYPVDLKTLDRFAGPLVIGPPGSVGRPLAVTGGFARFPVGADPKPLVVTASDGSRAIVTPDWPQADSDSGFVETDRPIYRPGDTVRIRAVIRRGHIGAYTIPVGNRHVVVRCRADVIYDRVRPISAFGSLEASVPLAPDAGVGGCSVDVGPVYGGFSVQAYRKPEYELTVSTDKDSVVGGDPAVFHAKARYFFGRPAAGLLLHYTIRGGAYRSFGWDTYAWVDGRTVFRDPDILATGDATVDARGMADVTFVTPHVDATNTIELRLDGRDASGRTVSKRFGLWVDAGSFLLDVSPDRWFGAAGRVTSFSVTARDRSGRVRSALPLTIEAFPETWNAKRKQFDDGSPQRFDLITDDRGIATLAWTPPGAGTFKIRATGKDERGNVVRASTYYSVAGDVASGWLDGFERIGVVAAAETISPDERAHVLLMLPKADRDVAVLVFSDRLASARVMHVAGQTASLDIAPPQDARTFTVAAMMPGRNGLDEGEVEITVEPPRRRLDVDVASAQRSYAPGEKATFTVTVRDATGRGVPAEIDFKAVDSAIYALARDWTRPFDELYMGYGSAYVSSPWRLDPTPNDRMGGLHTIANVTARYAMAEVLPGAVLEPPTHVRSLFEDTAFWVPSIVTNDRGVAHVSFSWPENLTTWRATAVAVTKATSIGSGTSDVLVTKPFLVRLETPRFLRAGDRSRISGIANGTPDRPSVTLRLLAPWLLAEATPPVASFDLGPAADGSAWWPVVAPGTGSLPITLFGSDGLHDDAMRLELPLEAATPAEHVRDFGALPDRGGFDVSVPSGYVAGAVHVSLAPSLVARLEAGQRLLDVYPYECTEQTLSAALPAVYVETALKGAGSTLPAELAPATVIRHAVERLETLQHGDGGFGWWESDATDPFMTAYAVYALSEFRKAGFDEGNYLLDNALTSLEKQLAAPDVSTLRYWGGNRPNDEWNTRAFMLFAQAQAESGGIDRDLVAQTAAHAPVLNSYALAVLGLCEHALGNDKAARSLLAELDRRAIRSAAFTYWRGDEWRSYWEDDPIETTAYALRFENAMNAGSARTAPIVNFLRAENRGSWWFTTKDTAAAIVALSETLQPTADELNPDETVRVLVDGREVRKVHVTSAVLDPADASVVVPAGDVHDGSRISLERFGRGALYWSSDAVRYVPTSATRASDAGEAVLTRLFAAAPPLEVQRRYVAPHAGPWRVGDEIVVYLTIRARSGAQYVALEDPFPAGAEHQPLQGEAARDAWSGVQLFDDRAAFFTDGILPNEPINIRYTLRVTTPGHYTAPAPSVYAMYGPPVSALGQPQDIEVVP